MADHVCAQKLDGTAVEAKQQAAPALVRIVERDRLHRLCGFQQRLQLGIRQGARIDLGLAVPESAPWFDGHVAS